jgi:histidinol-phosphatase (PHP family)
MESFVQYAISKKMPAYGISSHAPVPFDTRWAMKSDDVPEYIQEFNRLKIKYADRIELYLGLEIDYFVNDKTFVFDSVKDLPLDYRIGSIHFTDTFSDGTRWIIDGTPHAFMVATEQIYGGDVKKTVSRYFELSEEMVSNADFDIIGHMDKIVPNASQYAAFRIEDKWYKDKMLSLLTLIKEKGIVVEINTKSLFGRNFTFPNQLYLKTICEMQIPIMINSDCHYPDKVMDGFNDAYQLIKAAGFKTLRMLKEGKWIDKEISEFERLTTDV